MRSLEQVLKALRPEFARLRTVLNRVESAVEALSGLLSQDSAGGRRLGYGRRGRRMPLAAGKKIAAPRKAHWAKQGHRMRRLREQCGFNQREVDRRTDRIAQQKNNKALHVSRTYLRDIERGTSVPSMDKLKALALVYEQDHEELVKPYHKDLLKLYGAF